MSLSPTWELATEQHPQDITKHKQRKDEISIHNDLKKRRNRNLFFKKKKKERKKAKVH
jgi:hypothetical protein